MNRIVLVLLCTVLNAINMTPAVGLTPPPIPPRHTFTVNDGDTRALVEAIESAKRDYAGHDVRIDVSGDFHFDETGPLPPIEGSLFLLGPARFIGGGVGPAKPQGDQRGPAPLIEVRPGSVFSMSLVELSGFSLNHDEPALIDNQGRLSFQKVQIRDVHSQAYCRESCTPNMPIFRNGPDASMELNQVSVINSGATFSESANRTIVLDNQGQAVIWNSQFYFDANRTGWSRNYLFNNRGTLQVGFSTLFFNRSRNQEYPEVVVTDTDSNALTFFGESAISGFGRSVCRQAVSSGNTVIDVPTSDCDWQAPGDRTGVDVRLVWRRVDANWKPGPQFLTHAMVPLSDSPVIGTVPFDQCPNEDLLDVYRVTEPLAPGGPDMRRCDAGAVAYREPELSHGGINGYYYNPDDDGHYIYIQQTDALTLVTWNTFDADGNWAWIVGYAEQVQGGKIVAESYVNRKGEVSPATVNPESGAQYWGVIEIEMSDCWDGVVRYESEYPGFSNGEFPIRRLAFVKQVGCTD